MKLVKLNTDHYIVVDNSEIKEGDWFLNLVTNQIHQAIKYSDIYLQVYKDCKKITYSTQPLYKNDFWAIQELKLSEVKELIGVVDVEKKAESYAKDGLVLDTPYANGLFYGYIKGYTQAIEDNKEKKYTEEDMRKAMSLARKGAYDMTFDSFDNIIQSLQPKTEWEVEIVDGKLKLK